jgi:hypothetical protein
MLFLLPPQYGTNSISRESNLQILYPYYPTFNPHLCFFPWSSREPCICMKGDFTVWMAHCPGKDETQNHEFTLLCQTPGNHNLKSSMKNEANNPKLCTTFKNHKCSIHNVELIYSTFY